jgi:hypothetical protein
VREAKLVREIVIEDVDRIGVVADISRLLGDMGINLSAVSASVDGDSVQIRLRPILRQAGDAATGDVSFAWNCRRITKPRSSQITIESQRAGGREQGSSFVEQPARAAVLRGR